MRGRAGEIAGDGSSASGSWSASARGAVGACDSAPRPEGAHQRQHGLIVSRIAARAVFGRPTGKTTNSATMIAASMRTPLPVGSTLHAHDRFALATNVKIHPICDTSPTPQQHWQHGPAVQ